MKRALCSARRNMEAQQSLTLPSMQSEELPGSPHGHAVCSKLDNTPGVNSRVGTLIMTNPLYEPGCSCVRDFLYTAEVSSLMLFRQVQMSVNCKYIFIYTHIHIYIYIAIVCIYLVMSMGEMAMVWTEGGKVTRKHDSTVELVLFLSPWRVQICEHELIFVLS